MRSHSKLLALTPRRLVLLLGVLCVWSQVTMARAEVGPWREELSDPANEIIVQSRKLDDKLTEFRGVTRLKTSLSSLVAVLQDVEHAPAWAYRTILAMRLATVSQNEAIVYSVADLDWPFRDRDLIVRTRIRQDPMSLAVTISAQAEPDYLPLDPAYVRVPFLKSSWTFEPIGQGVVEVLFRGHGDVGGTLSEGIGHWFAGAMIAEAPYETLLGLRRTVRQARYQQAIVSGIREPGTGGATSPVQGRTKRRSIRSASSK